MSTARTAVKPAESSTREVRRLASLLDTSQALTGTIDLKAGLHRVLEILGRHHGAVRSTVVMLDEDAATGAQLHLRADHVEPQGCRRARRRSQVQARSRLRSHPEIPRRRRVD